MNTQPIIRPVLFLAILLIGAHMGIAQPSPVSATIGTLPKGKTLKIVYDATINTGIPSSNCQVSHQGTVSGTNFSSVLTDDPVVGGTSDPTVTLVEKTSTPTITGTVFCSGATSVSGSSTEADGTTITIYNNNTSVGTTTVTSNTWSRNVTLAAGTLHATATATGACESDASESQTVRQTPSATLTGDATLCPGQNATLTITLGEPAPVDGVTGKIGNNLNTTLIDFTIAEGQTVTTVNVSPTTTTIYSIASLSNKFCAAPSENITGTATVTVQQVSDAPTINSPICAGATTVSGTSTEANGTEIKVYNSAIEIGATTVLSGKWQATVAALPNGAVITAKAKASGECQSAASASVTVTNAVDVKVNKSGPATVNAGSNIVYTITVENLGPCAATNIILSETVPANTTFVSFTGPASGWKMPSVVSGAPGGTTFQATATSLAANSGPQVFTLTVNVAASVAHNTLISNTASIASDGTDQDPDNNQSTATTTVIACVITCPGDVTAYTGTRTTCDASVTLPAPTITGTCGVLTYSIGSTTITSPHTFPVGETTVTISTGAGPSCTFKVTVIDNTPPKFTVNTAAPSALWPPNHKMRDVTLNYSATDNCSGTITYSIVSVTSNEPDNGTSDGDKPDDIVIVDNTHLQLRAERAGTGSGRLYTIEVKATDANGNSATQNIYVVVAHDITSPVSGASFKIGSTVPFTGVFWDIPGNRHTGKWLIDGNTSIRGSVTEPSGLKNGKVTGSYKFTTAGVYKLQMNVTDQNGVTSYANTNGDLDAIVVVYDPNGGYTYGGGYFASPVGALMSDPTATGKVSYGFTVNYYKGATYPKGETQFDFKVGELEYNALNFDYLSISGARAQFKGSGKIIGGQSGINFIMTVIDGQLDGTGIDKVRIKIYNKNTGYVYYDNEPGFSEADDPKTKVGTGSQVVIKGTAVQTNTFVTRAENLQEATDLELTVLPNPTRNTFSVFVRSDNVRDRITLQVFDQWGRKVEVRTLAQELTHIGDAYRPGIYYIRVVQGRQHREVKLLKLPD